MESAPCKRSAPQTRSNLCAILEILVIVPCGHPFGTEAPADHLGRGFFLNSSQIFPSSKGNPQHLPAMKGGSDGAPSPSPVPALKTRSPAPPCGASLFSWPPRGERGIALGQPQQAPPLPLGRGRPLCGRVRGFRSIIEAVPPQPPSPRGEGRRRPFAREPMARRRVIPATDLLPPNAPSPGGWS